MDEINKLSLLPSKIQESLIVLGVESIEEYGEQEIYTDKGGASYESLEDFLMGGIFNFCCCGIPSEIIDIVGTFLISYQIENQKLQDCISELVIYEKHEKAHREYEKWFNTNKELYSFLLYFLDSIEMLEHGGCVTASWITDKGKAYIEIYNYYKKQKEEKLKGENNNE